MKKLLVILIALSIITLGISLAFAENGEKTAVRVASLKGSTTMGLVKLMNDDQNGVSANDYDFKLEGTADAITPLLIRGELDIAMLPCNLASVLYNRTDGELQMLAINTLGVLYVLEAGDTVHSVEDLRGKTVYSTGLGTTPQFAMNYVLGKNGIDPETDLNIEYKSESTEVASAMLNDSAAIAVLPQPYVTGVLTQNPNVRVALSLSDEWDKVGEGSAMITAVALARRDFVEKNPQAISDFLGEYAASVEYVNANPKEAAVWIGELEIAKAPIAEKAIPECNIVCITGDEMQTKASGYLEALYAQNPDAVGGKLPDEAFYYTPEN